MNISQIKRSINLLLQKDQVITPYIHGKPGIGKSDIVRQIAKERDIAFIDLRLSQLESADIRGIPHCDQESKSSKWYPPETIPFTNFAELPIPGDEARKFKDGGILFLDEFNRARFDVLQAAFQLVLDRQVGLHKVLPNWYIVCAGNLGEADQTEVTEISDSALKNRFAHFEVEDSGLFDCWMKWALESKIHNDVIGFLRSKPSYLYTEPNDNEYTFCTPRIWEKFSDILKANPEMDPNEITELVGKSIINSAAIHFVKYLADKKTIKPEDILKRYQQIKKSFDLLQRDQVFSITNELQTRIRDNPSLTEVNIQNIHDFMTDQLEDDHKIAFLKDINEVEITFKKKKREFIDIYLDMFENMNEIIVDLMSRAEKK